jgi:hypothetical protein
MSSNFDISPKQSLELARSIEQAARQADAVIELTKELRLQLRQYLKRTACIDGVIELTKKLREQLRQDIRRRSARPNGVSHRRWNSGSLFLAMPVSDR